MKFNFKILVFLIFALIITGAVLFYEGKIEREISSISLTDFVFPKRENLPIYLKLLDDVKKDYVSFKKDFLEVNLDKMKIRLFKQGSLIKEVPILAKGDSQGWGGSAIGLYKILRGYKLSYSSIEDVYMPYALHYYGKYYIHGEPYYPWGRKLISEFSGGCLRLKDEDARSIFQLTDLNMPVLVVDKEKDQKDYEVIPQKPEVSAKSFLLADLDSGFVFAEKDSSTPLPIASLTKLMTAVIVAENVNLRRSVFVRQEMLDLGHGETEGLDVNERFKTVELFYPLLIESSNDAAFALSWLLGQQRTIDLMNEKARSILMENTRFVEPSGFDPANISTAKDLFYLARYILNNRYPILEIAKGNEVTSFGSVSFDIENLWNKNIFIYDPTFIGGKTGYIRESKHTALFLFKLDQRSVAIILLGSNNLRQDTQRLYIWLQKNYFN